MALHGQANLQHGHRRNIIISWSIISLFQLHPTLFTSWNMWYPYWTTWNVTFSRLSLLSVLCTFLLWNKFLTTFRAHPASCDSSFRIQFKCNHVSSLRNPFQVLSILVTSLSYLLSCQTLCISIITFKQNIQMSYHRYRLLISDCKILEFKSFQPFSSSLEIPFWEVSDLQ